MEERQAVSLTRITRASAQRPAKDVKARALALSLFQSRPARAGIGRDMVLQHLAMHALGLQTERF